MSISRNNYNNITVGDRMYGLSPTGRFPLGIDQVKTSKSELEKYIKLSDEDGGNAYPGMLIAVDDDLTYAGNDAPNNERGIYWITRNRNNNNAWMSYCLAYTDQIPTKQPGQYSDGTHYVYSDGHINNTKTILSSYAWFYEHNFGNSNNTQYLRIAHWGVDKSNNKQLVDGQYLSLALPESRKDSTKYHTGIIGNDLAKNLDTNQVWQDSTVDDEVRIGFINSFYDYSHQHFDLSKAKPGTPGVAGVVSTTLANNLDNFISYQINDNNKVRVSYRNSVFSNKYGEFEIKEALPVKFNELGNITQNVRSGVVSTTLSNNLDNNTISQIDDNKDSSNKNVIIEYVKSFHDRQPDIFTLRPANPTKKEYSVTIPAKAGTVSIDLAENLNKNNINVNGSTDRQIQLNYVVSFFDYTSNSITIRPAIKEGQAGIIPYDMSKNLANNYIKQQDDTGSGTYLRFEYRTSFYNDCTSTFGINVANQNDLGLMSSEDKCTVDAAYVLLNKLNENDCPWDDLYEPDGNQTSASKPVMSTANIYSNAVNGKMYEIQPIIS